jgi:hypothetical protein
MTNQFVVTSKVTLHQLDLLLADLKDSPFSKMRSQRWPSCQLFKLSKKSRRSKVSLWELAVSDKQTIARNSPRHLDWAIDRN